MGLLVWLLQVAAVLAEPEVVRPWLAQMAEHRKQAIAAGVIESG